MKLLKDIMNLSVGPLGFSVGEALTCFFIFFVFYVFMVLGNI